MNFVVRDDQAMQELAQKLVKTWAWPFCLELVGDVGAGKTTFVKGLVRGLGSAAVVSSPSFTINNRYYLDDAKILSHYDFYRLHDGGLMHQGLAEDLADRQVSVVVEWAESITAVLPTRRYRLQIAYLESGRSLSLEELGV